jgi:hypothetical protein
MYISLYEGAEEAFLSEIKKRLLENKEEITEEKIKNILNVSNEVGINKNKEIEESENSYNLNLTIEEIISKLDEEQKLVKSNGEKSCIIISLYVFSYEKPMWNLLIESGLFEEEDLLNKIDNSDEITATFYLDNDNYAIDTLKSLIVTESWKAIYLKKYKNPLNPNKCLVIKKKLKNL